MSGILGGILGGGVDEQREQQETSDLPAAAPRGRVAERVLAAELLAELREIRASMTEFGERLTTGAVNHVLEVATRAFPTSGVVTRSFGSAVGSVEVRNLSSSDTVTVVAGSPTSSVPAAGVGVYVVPAAATAQVNIGDRAVTFWGTAAETFSYQALTTGTAQPQGRGL